VALKILVPVLPSDQFDDAVVAAGDLVAREGGTITFFFTKLRPPPDWEEKRDLGNEVELDSAVDLDVDDDIETWEDQMAAGLDDARNLLLERGLGEDQISVIFGNPDAPPAQAIADEAAAGAYDMVVLPRSAIVTMPDELSESMPTDIAAAVRELADDGVRLLVT